MDQPQSGDTVPVRMGWKLPDGTRLRVTFEAQVEALELGQNRMRCRLLRIQAASGNRPEAKVAPHYLALVMDLIGKRAMIPLEAMQGLVLPLRFATLTGEHGYFFD